MHAQLKSLCFGLAASSLLAATAAQAQATTVLYNERVVEIG